jgi:hypothetical protein
MQCKFLSYQLAGTITHVWQVGVMLEKRFISLHSKHIMEDCSENNWKLTKECIYHPQERKLKCNQTWSHTSVNGSRAWVNSCWSTSTYPTHINANTRCNIHRFTVESLYFHHLDQLHMRRLNLSVLTHISITSKSPDLLSAQCERAYYHASHVNIE